MTFNAHTHQDTMPAMQLVIPLRSGEILDIIKRELRAALEGRPHCSKRQMDLIAEALGEAEAREQDVVNRIEAMYQAEQQTEARRHIPGRDRATIHIPGQPKPAGKAQS